LPRRLARLVLLAVLLFLAGSLGAVLGLRWIDPPFTTVMLLQEGPVGDLEHTWVPRDAIAWDAARAVIAAEDQRFAEHNGIDFKQLNEAIEDYRDGDELRGASTITQQVAKNVLLWQGRSVVRKGLDAYFAVLIELCWPKERILEVYLNVAEFGPGIFGIEAAAREHFGSSAASLSLDEAATLAAVLPNPLRMSASRPSDYVRERREAIVEQVRLLESRGHYRGIEW
jgi:monofunctional biosynthetic peptidoglycan transglycosylase